jgi:hypothetical protein
MEIWYVGSKALFTLPPPSDKTQINIRCYLSFQLFSAMVTYLVVLMQFHLNEVTLQHNNSSV